MAKPISVKLAQLAEPLVTSRIKPGTTIVSYLESHKLEYSASVRVNAAVVNKGYELKNGDIITVIGKVSGGY